MVAPALSLLSEATQIQTDVFFSPSYQRQTHCPHSHPTHGIHGHTAWHAWIETPYGMHGNTAWHAWEHCMGCMGTLHGMHGNTAWDAWEHCIACIKTPNGMHGNIAWHAWKHRMACVEHRMACVEHRMVCMEIMWGNNTVKTNCHHPLYMYMPMAIQTERQLSLQTFFFLSARSRAKQGRSARVSSQRYQSTNKGPYILQTGQAMNTGITKKHVPGQVRSGQDIMILDTNGPHIQGDYRLIW